MASSYRRSAEAGASQFLTDSFQRGLAHWNRERLAPQFPAGDWQTILDRDHRMLRLEGGFIEELRARRLPPRPQRCRPIRPALSPGSKG
jgi:hypothetical protein